eukprot:596228_1
MSLRKADAFTISSIPIRQNHRHMRPSVALNVAMDPRTLGLNGLNDDLNHNLNLNEFNPLNNLNQLDQQLSQKDEFPLPHSTNPYIILGIRHTPSTTISELKSAYRRAVLLYHPDTRDQFWEYGKEDGGSNNSGNSVNDGKEAYSDFRRINAAYETIYTTLFGFAPCTRVSSRLNP